MKPFVICNSSSETMSLVTRLLALSCTPPHVFVIADEHPQTPSIDLIADALTEIRHREDRPITITSEMMKPAYLDCMAQAFERPDNRPFYAKIKGKTRNKRR